VSGEINRTVADAAAAIKIEDIFAPGAVAVDIRTA
jgi:hypothetical protein